MNVRLDAEGRRVTQGEQIEIGGNDRYAAVCPKRWYTGVRRESAAVLPGAAAPLPGSGESRPERPTVMKN